jgi:hypothetical protein
MKVITLAFALAAALPLIGGAAANAAPDRATTVRPASEASQLADTSARRKVRRHGHAYRSYGSFYGYDRPYGTTYYRGIRPGWGYGPDPGDYAWPPFHFKPYW